MILKAYRKARLPLTTLALFILVFLFTSPMNAHADQEEASIVENVKEAVEETAQELSWEALTPTTKGYDWVQLKSGEWVKGQIKAFYGMELEFESDEFDLVYLDWEDIKKIRGYRPLSIRFVGQGVIDGFLEVDEDKVFVLVGEERKEFNRNQLVAIVPARTEDSNYWSGKVSIGITLMGGNSMQKQASGIAKIMRRTTTTRFITDYLGNYTNTDGEETVNNHRISSNFDIFITRQFFYRPFSGEYYRDPFKNIRHRITVGAGAGYRIIDTNKTKWDISCSPAFQWTQFNTVEQGNDRHENTPAFVGGTHLEKELTKTVDFNFQYNFQVISKKAGTYNHHMMATVETEFIRGIDLDTSFVWDRAQEPTQNADGTEPKRDDYYVIFSLGYEF